MALISVWVEPGRDLCWLQKSQVASFTVSEITRIWILPLRRCILFRWVAQGVANPLSVLDLSRHLRGMQALGTLSQQFCKSSGLSLNSPRIREKVWDGPTDRAPCWLGILLPAQPYPKHSWDYPTLSQLRFTVGELSPTSVLMCFGTSVLLFFQSVWISRESLWITCDQKPEEDKQQTAVSPKGCRGFR